jgi:hypothetical protein
VTKDGDESAGNPGVGTSGGLLIALVTLAVARSHTLHGGTATEGR